MGENKNFFRASAEDFKKIPGSPVAYWASNAIYDLYAGQPLSQTVGFKEGITTGDNSIFLRMWFEVSNEKFGMQDGMKWIPCNKGGEFRKWFGNREYVINWTGNGQELRNFKGCSFRNSDFQRREGGTFSNLTSGRFSARYCEEGFAFESKGTMFFTPDLRCVIAYMNSEVFNRLIGFIAPTLDYKLGMVQKLPLVVRENESVERIAHSCIEIAGADWNDYETSWDFSVNPLMAARNVSGASDKLEFQLSALYVAVREKWAKNCEEMRRLETENNRIFIDAYGLQDELTPEVPWHEITLTCNPWYRYSAECGVQSAELPRDGKLEERLKGDTVKELISYAVGCMMGRYSLEKPGLVLADQGATLADYWEKVRSEECGVRSEGGDVSEAGGMEDSTPHSALNTPHSFTPDDDGIIPILDNDWFADDIVTRFKEFVKVAFGESHFFENVAWIEEALGKGLRDYFTKDFYKDHLQRYQNRPIYWLFQSPKGAFRALVYMHRYKPDMVGGVLGYLRSLQTKVENQLGVATQIASDESKSSTERVRANKEVVKYSKMQKELDEYEKHVLYPLSTERIEIDLDDGVKVNYKKFGVALRKVAALEGRSAE